MNRARLERQRACVLVVDLQEKLLPAMCDGAGCVSAAGKLIAAAEVLGVPVLATEQYPAGLGPTCPPIRELLKDRPRHEKMIFSACVPAIMEQLHAAAGRGREQVIVVGIETHVCIQQTVMDVLRHGLQAWVCADGVSSRRAFDRDIALESMRWAGASVTTVESVIFELLGEAGTEEFKKILRVVK